MPYGTIGGGRQLGDGNPNEIILTATQTPAAVTATATLTTAQVGTGHLVSNPGGGAAATYTLPTATAMDSLLGNARVGDAFDLFVTNVSTTSAETATIAAGTGWTLVGNMLVAANNAATTISSGRFRARKTAATGAWTLYRIC